MFYVFNVLYFVHSHDCDKSVMTVIFSIFDCDWLYFDRDITHFDCDIVHFDRDA